MDDSITKVSRTILQPTPNFVIKFHLKLTRTDAMRNEVSVHSEYKFKDKTYVNIEAYPFITFDLKSEEWSKDKNVMVDTSSIYLFIKGFKKVRDAIYNEKIFAMDKAKNVVIYADLAEKYSVTINNVKFAQAMMVKPTIIYDENETSYEGVIIYINKTDNFVELSIDAFENMIYILEKVDMFVYSQELLNYIHLVYKDGEKLNPPTKRTSMRKNIFLEPKKEIGISSTFSRSKDEADDIFDGLK